MFQRLGAVLARAGLDMAVVVVPEKGALTGLSIEQIERGRKGQIFCRPDSTARAATASLRPIAAWAVQGGDGV